MGPPGGAKRPFGPPNQEPQGSRPVNKKKKKLTDKILPMGGGA